MKTKKIGLVGIYFPGAYDALHENVPEGFELVDALSPEAYGNLADCEYLISRLDIDPDIINHTPNVKFWQRWGAGFDHVDLKAWGERGIPIATCPGVNSGIVAELAIMLMLAGYRNLLQINRISCSKPRRHKIPPKTLGCSVFTRPPKIEG